MANLPVSENPKFTSEIEKFEKSDPQHASEFNARMKILFENELALNRDKASKSTTYEKTILASEWTGTEPYTVDLEVPDVDQLTNVEIVPGELTVEQWESMTDASITRGTQDTGMITLYAYGNKPNVDLPIKIIVRGD